MIDQPLRGKRIAITRPEGQARELIEHLRTLGAEAIATPTIAIAPLADFTALDAAIAQIATYDWVIATSANGVDALFDRMAPVLWVIAILGNLTVIHRMIFTYGESKRLEDAQLRARAVAASSGSRSAR